MKVGTDSRANASFIVIRLSFKENISLPQLESRFQRQEIQEEERRAATGLVSLTVMKL